MLQLHGHSGNWWAASGAEHESRRHERCDGGRALVVEPEHLALLQGVHVEALAVQFSGSKVALQLSVYDVSGHLAVQRGVLERDCPVEHFVLHLKDFVFVLKALIGLSDEEALLVLIIEVEDLAQLESKLGLQRRLAGFWRCRWFSSFLFFRPDVIHSRRVQGQ